jgi:glutaredoxin 3
MIGGEGPGMSVKLYSTPTCPFCKMTREFLEQHGVSYEDVNVAEDREGAKEMIEKSGQLGVPVVDFDGRIIVGFDRGRIGSALGL